MTESTVELRGTRYTVELDDNGALVDILDIEYIGGIWAPNIANWSEVENLINPKKEA